MQELIQYFSLEHVTKSAGIFDEEKLLWLNSHYIKETPLPELARLLVPFLEKAGIGNHDPGYLVRVAGTLNTRSKTLGDMAERARFYFQDPAAYEEKAAKKFLTPDTAPRLEKIARRLEALPQATEEALNLMFQELEAETGLKMGKLAQPVRVALTGKSESPGLFEIINILGQPVALRRLRRAVEFIRGTAHSS
jgi:glutamyl-tRNA synthetase